MPQLNQLELVLFSQFFWLLLVLGLIYFGIGKAMLPKIQSTVDLRESRIDDDLAAAQKAREDADKTEEAYRLAMDESRTEAQKQLSAAKAKAAKATEKKMATAMNSIDQKTSEAETAIRAAHAEAITQLSGVAGELTQDIVAKVAGLKVEKAAAAAAAKSVMADA